MIPPRLLPLALCLWPLLTGAEEVPYGFAAAQKRMGDFTAAPGLTATLFAAEPQIQNPTNLDIDPRGRVWATEGVDYRIFKPWGVLRPEGDRVVILEDTKGTGVADKETTFWQAPELKAPLGLCVLPQKVGTKVIVSAAPNVWLLTDSTGNDHADKVQKLFTVGGNWDHDHQVHAFSFGPDGKFYFNCGNESQKLMDPAGKVIVDVAGHPVECTGHPYRGGLVFRCDIDLEKGEVKNVETLAWNFRNNFKVAVDSFGTLWQSDNDDDGNKSVRINYVMPWGNYGYSDEMTGASWQTPRTNFEKEIPQRHWHQNDPGSIPNLLMTGGGSPTGMVINEGTLLGAPFTNQMIHCDAGPRVVRAYPVTPDGAGYKATSVDLLTSKDPWFRPADAAIAPDGSLFIADWYDQTVGGHNMADHEKNHVRGRIYRVAPEGAPAKISPPDFSTAEGAIAALTSPNKSTQYAAWQSLHAMGSGAVPALQKLADSENPRWRARALGVLISLPSAAAEAFRKGASDPDPNVRAAALRLITEASWTGGFDFSSVMNDATLLERLLHDPDPMVRREMALSLHGGQHIVPLWVPLALQYRGGDRWALEALGIGAAGSDEACLQAWLAATNGAGWETPAGRDLIWRLRAPSALPMLARIAADPQNTPAEVPRFLRAFDFHPASPEKTTALLQLAALGPQQEFIAGEALARLKGVDQTKFPELKALLEKVLAAARGTGALYRADSRFQGARSR